MPLTENTIRTARTQEPLFEIAQLAHVELFTPKLDETLHFFKELLGLEETEREGQSVYLRAYEDFYHHTLKVTEAPQPGLGHLAWRTTSPQALERRVAALETSGLGLGWSEGDRGHGAAYRFTTPAGHPMELLWEVEYYAAPVDKQSLLLNRPQKRPLHGAPVRRLDHVNLMADEVPPTRRFLQEQLGFRLREHILFERGKVEVGAWLSVSALVHEIALLRGSTRSRGRLHHICYWYGFPQHLIDAAEILCENGITIEAGPGKHGIAQALFMYVFEPGGNRVELFGDSGYLIFDPAWKPVIWHEENMKQGAVFYGGALPAEFFTYGTPQVEEVVSAMNKGV